MTDVWTRPLLRRDEPRWGSRVPWLAAVLAAGWALLAGIALASLPGLVIWLGGGADAPVSEPLRIGGAVWLAAHRVGLTIDGATLQLVPGGLAILIALLIYRAARWAAHESGIQDVRAAAGVVVPAAATYAAAGGVIAGLMGSEPVTVMPQHAVIWTLLVATCAAGLGVAREAGLVQPLLGRLSHWQCLALRAAAVAVAGLLAVGAGLVAASAIVHADRVGCKGVFPSRSVAPRSAPRSASRRITSGGQPDNPGTVGPPDHVRASGGYESSIAMTVSPPAVRSRPSKPLGSRSPGRASCAAIDRS